MKNIKLATKISIIVISILTIGLVVLWKSTDLKVSSIMKDQIMDEMDDAIIIEFKVQDTEETELTETVCSALKQIEERDYQASLIARGIPKERIRKYGFAFCGKRVLIAQQDPVCLQ